MFFIFIIVKCDCFKLRFYADRSQSNILRNARLERGDWRLAALSLFSPVIKKHVPPSLPDFTKVINYFPAIFVLLSRLN